MQASCRHHSSGVRHGLQKFSVGLVSLHDHGTVRICLQKRNPGRCRPQPCNRGGASQSRCDTCGSSLLEPPRRGKSQQNTQKASLVAKGKATQPSIKSWYQSWSVNGFHRFWFLFFMFHVIHIAILLFRRTPRQELPQKEWTQEEEASAFSCAVLLLAVLCSC